MAISVFMSAPALNAPAKSVDNPQLASIADFNTFANAVVAITGDTYNTTSMQFTTGGSTGLTHAQWATLAAQFNTAATALLAGANPANSVAQLSWDPSVITLKGQLRTVLHQIFAGAPGVQ